MRRGVTVEKALEPQHVGIFRAPDDHRPTDAGLQHLRRREISARMSRSPRPASAMSSARIRSGGRSAPRPARARSHRRTTAGRQAAQARPGKRRAEREEVLAPAKRVVAVDVDLSAQQDGKPDADLADRRQRFAGVEAARLAEAPRALDIVGVEMGEDLLAARFDYGRVVVAHVPFVRLADRRGRPGRTANLPVFGIVRLPAPACSANIDRRT